jgi:hypothetical protein
VVSRNVWGIINASQLSLFWGNFLNSSFRPPIFGSLSLTASAYSHYLASIDQRNKANDENNENNDASLTGITFFKMGFPLIRNSAINSSWSSLLSGNYDVVVFFLFKPYYFAPFQSFIFPAVLHNGCIYIIPSTHSHVTKRWKTKWGVTLFIFM